MTTTAGPSTEVVPAPQDSSWHSPPRLSEAAFAQPAPHDLSSSSPALREQQIRELPYPFCDRARTLAPLSVEETCTIENSLHCIKVALAMIAPAALLDESERGFLEQHPSARGQAALGLEARRVEALFRRLHRQIVHELHQREAAAEERQEVQRAITALLTATNFIWRASFGKDSAGRDVFSEHLGMMLGGINSSTGAVVKSAYALHSLLLPAGDEEVSTSTIE